MEIRNLITFTKVAETQSLSKAAKALGYAQSTVTMQMQQLEQELGAQLYERVGKQIRITQTGQEFLSYAGAIVRMSEEALQVGKQDTSAVSGSLRLGILSPLSPEVAATMETVLADSLIFPTSRAAPKTVRAAAPRIPPVRSCFFIRYFLLSCRFRFPIFRFIL